MNRDIFSVEDQLYRLNDSYTCKSLPLSTLDTSKHFNISCHIDTTVSLSPLLHLNNSAAALEHRSAIITHLHFLIAPWKSVMLVVT